MEEGLRHRGLAGVVGELTRLTLTPSRRLQLAAEASSVTALVVTCAGARDANRSAIRQRRWRRSRSTCGAATSHAQHLHSGSAPRREHRGEGAEFLVWAGFRGIDQRFVRVGATKARMAFDAFGAHALQERSCSTCMAMNRQTVVAIKAHSTLLWGEPSIDRFTAKAYADNCGRSKMKPR